MHGGAPKSKYSATCKLVLQRLDRLEVVTLGRCHSQGNGVLKVRGKLQAKRAHLLIKELLETGEG